MNENRLPNSNMINTKHQLIIFGIDIVGKNMADRFSKTRTKRGNEGKLLAFFIDEYKLDTFIMDYILVARVISFAAHVTNSSEVLIHQKIRNSLHFIVYDDKIIVLHHSREVRTTISLYRHNALHVLIFYY